MKAKIASRKTTVTKSGPGRLEAGVVGAAGVAVAVGTAEADVGGCSIPSSAKTDGRGEIESSDRHPASTAHRGYCPGPWTMLRVGTYATGPSLIGVGILAAGALRRPDLQRPPPSPTPAPSDVREATGTISSTETANLRTHQARLAVDEALLTESLLLLRGRRQAREGPPRCVQRERRPRRIQYRSSVRVMQSPQARSCRERLPGSNRSNRAGGSTV